MRNNPSKPASVTPNLQGSDRREVPRYPFVASAEETDVSTQTKLSARVSELSLRGCYLDMLNPFPKATEIRLAIFHGDAKFTPLATVVYSQPHMGMGILFKAVEPGPLEVLRTWLTESSST